jgi:hypothetical protein
LDYDYFELTLTRNTDARVLADSVYRILGAKAVAVFAPLLGFASNQALVLVERGADAAAVLGQPGVLGGVQSRLSPTLRPKDGARPAPLGVYVHNWFTVEGSTDEFLRLSGEAWPDFEAHFETKIFGLFLADASEADRHEGARRFLLMTGYKDLGEWQRSRNPAPTARAAFQRRRELTRVSLARSCTLIPRSAA